MRGSRGAPHILVLAVATCGAYILLSTCAAAQPADAAVPTARSGSPAAIPSLWTSAGLEAITTRSGGLRLVAGTGNDYLMLAPITVALVRDGAGGRLHVSANPVILVVPALLDLLGSSNNGYRWQSLAWVGFFLSLANPTLQYPILKDRLYVDAALRNDIFFFETPAETYSEVSFGLHGRLGGIQAGARAVLPLADVYARGRKPYIGISLFGLFR
ncbi:MAG: hypothetical protein JST22_09600 [Bacteroidetes bacterium]|nr:hypothetical protein [Bacteroidota bacterium]